MSLKQSSFNFDFLPDEPIAQENKQPGIIPASAIKNEVEQTSPIPSAPIEMDWTPTVEKVRIVKTKSSSSKRGRMKISDMAATADLVEVPEDEELFSKSYYSIGVVSNMFKVNHSLLRFWENEFDILKPKKNGKGDRLFRPQDIKNLKLIHHLLRERKYTIEGAKDFLKKSKLADQRFGLIDSLKDLRGFLLEIKAGL
jgi:DNA-binding transcriptional MerR regulator